MTQPSTPPPDQPGPVAQPHVPAQPGWPVPPGVLFSYLDGLWQLWDNPYRQCLHDKFAQTVVVRVAP